MERARKGTARPPQRHQGIGCFRRLPKAGARPSNVKRMQKLCERPDNCFVARLDHERVRGQRSVCSRVPNREFHARTHAGLRRLATRSTSSSGRARLAHRTTRTASSPLVPSSEPCAHLSEMCGVPAPRQCSPKYGDGGPNAPWTTASNPRRQSKEHGVPPAAEIRCALRRSFGPNTWSMCLRECDS